MDSPRRRSGVLTYRLIPVAILFATLALAAVNLAASAPPPLHAMRWLAPGADASRILTMRPPECVAIPRDADTAWSVEVGRAAFRAPLLLGGQAARAGVACETCHRNGRTNPDFDFPGLSGAPGTADVTSFLFSSHRGDHIDNPKPIPDLGGPKRALKVSQAAGSNDLPAFIHGLVTQEFDGAEPPPTVLAGLTAYVRAMDPASCGGGLEPVRAAGAISDIRRAVQAAIGALARGDGPTATLMVEAARSMLGDVAERYADPSLSATRDTLDLAALDLTGVLNSIHAGSPSASERLAVWAATSDRFAAVVERNEARSLYSAPVVAATVDSHAAPR